VLRNLFIFYKKRKKAFKFYVIDSLAVNQYIKFVFASFLRQ